MMHELQWHEETRTSVAIRTACAVGLATACLAASPIFAAGAQAQVSNNLSVSAREMDKRARSQTQRTVSIVVQGMTIEQVMRHLANQAHYTLSVNFGAVPLDRKVQLALVKVNVLEAFALLLRGTGAVASLSPDGQAIIVSSASAGQSAVDTTGQLTVNVVDSATKSAVSGATVSLVDLKRSIVADNGSAAFARLAPGTYTVSVRRVGYRTKTQSVVVRAGALQIVVVSLGVMSTTLSEVVTTATGTQLRKEVGIDVPKIDVQEVVKTANVRTVTDILVARVPGVTVQRSSGAPGAPARIRIRGINSVSLSNDPIVVLDGVRIQGPDAAAFTSRLDDIDVNTLADIQVMKGPAAAAQYGTDAANGVIILTSRRPTAGRLRVNATYDQHIANPQPRGVGYRAHGSTGVSADPRNPFGARCDNSFITAGFCAGQDSLIIDRWLIDPRSKPDQREMSRSMSVGLQKGSSTFNYSIDGRLESQDGVDRLSDTARAVLQKAIGDVPDYFETPNNKSTAMLNGAIGASPRPNFNLSLRSGLTHSNTQRTQIVQDTGRTVHGTPTYEGLDRIMNSAQATYGWRTVQFTATAGADYTNSTTESFARPDDCISTQGGCNFRTLGSHSVSRVTRGMYNVQMRASTVVRLLPKLSMTPFISGDLVRNTVSGLSVSSTSIPRGTLDISSGNLTASQISANQSKGSANWAFAPRFNLADLVWLNVGLTRAQSNGDGDRARRPFYPNANISYLLIDKPGAVPLLGMISTFRVRAAYGQAGQQAGPNVRLAQYDQQVGTITMINAGNDLLVPERYTELEGGFDLDLFDGRVSTNATLAHKFTRNMMTSEQLAGSLGGGSRTVNIGDTDNRAFEANVNARIIENRSMSWSLSVNYSRIRNKLVRLSDNVSSIAGVAGSRVAVGYPLDGFWTRRPLGMNDLNGNGILEVGELFLTDSAVYVGSAMPKYEMAYNTTVSVLDNRLKMSALVSVKHGFTQELLTQDGRGNFDPKAPFADQLRAMLYTGAARPLNEEFGSVGTGYPQNISTVRLQSVSVTYDLPIRWSSVVRAPSASVSLAGNNVGLWSRYIGIDPDVNAITAGSVERNRDTGLTPMPRDWRLSVRLGF